MKKNYFLIVLLIISIIFINACTPNEFPSSLGGCTKEGKICPDGTVVGRVPPKCDFSLCPTTNEEWEWEFINCATHTYCTWKACSKQYLQDCYSCKGSYGGIDVKPAQPNIKDPRTSSECEKI